MKARVKHLVEFAQAFHHVGGLVGHHHGGFDQNDDDQYRQQEQPAELAEGFKEGHRRSGMVVREGKGGRSQGRGL